MNFTSTRDIDRKIEQTTNEIELTSFEKQFLSIRDEASKSFERLLRIKPIHRDHPIISSSYDKRRERQQRNRKDPASIVSLTKQFSETLKNISLGQGGAFENDRVRCFLDLGYYPGGFSVWLLSNNPTSQGVGIDSIPLDERVNNDALLENAHRYVIRAGDIIAMVLQAVENGVDPIIPLDAKEGDEALPNQYDLVIGAAFPTLKGRLPWWIRPQLVLSQLLIILVNTAEGGAAILHVNTKPFCWMAEVIAVLWECFGEVKAVAGGVHKKSSSCYLVCSRFCGSNEAIEKYGTNINAMLGHLRTHSQAEGSQDEEDPEISMETLSGRSHDEVLKEERHKVALLLKEQWDEQYQEMYDNLAKTIHSR